MVAYYTSKIPLAYQGIKQHLTLLETRLEGALIHDLYPFSDHAQMGFWERYQEKRWLSKLMKGDGPIYVFTEFTRKSIEKNFSQAKDAIKILPPQINELLVPNDEDARDVVRYQYTQGDAYFLCTAPIHESANIIPLLKGFSQFKKRTNSNMKLVLTGVKGEFSKGILQAIETYKYRNDLIFLDNLNATDQRDLLCSAYALVHPCRWERFGLPILDALRAGVAVLTAEESSMSELAGMAGMFFNEVDGTDIGEKLIRIYNDEQMRGEMIGTGLSRFR
jgi:glycosyltransferase involved in cell wall biosynthesis